MSETAETNKFTYSETERWANKESVPTDDGITFLYIFGAFAFLIIFAAVLLFFVREKSPVEIISIDEIGSETDSTTTEVHTEFDLIEDVQKNKNVIKEV